MREPTMLQSWPPKFVGGTIFGLELWLDGVAERESTILRFTSPTTTKRRNMGLGRYPEISIRDACDADLAARLLIQKGPDPIDEQ